MTIGMLIEVTGYSALYTNNDLSDGTKLGILRPGDNALVVDVMTFDGSPEDGCDLLKVVTAIGVGWINQDDARL